MGAMLTIQSGGGGAKGASLSEGRSAADAAPEKRVAAKASPRNEMFKPISPKSCLHFSQRQRFRNGQTPREINIVGGVVFLQQFRETIHRWLNVCPRRSWS